MDRDKVNPAQQAITGTVTLAAQLAGSSGRSMQVQFYAYDGESQQSLNDRCDIFQEVIERQRTRAEIPELEAKREQMIKHLGQARDVLADLEKKQEIGHLSSQERMNLTNMRVNISKVSEEIEKGEVAIKEAKKKAGVG